MGSPLTTPAPTPTPPLNRPPFPQWDGVENKTSVVVYGAGAVVLLWLASTVVSAVNAVPLVSGAGGAGGQATWSL